MEQGGGGGFDEEVISKRLRHEHLAACQFKIDRIDATICRRICFIDDQNKKDRRINQYVSQG
jgi:hypothetical protein